MTIVQRIFHAIEHAHKHERYKLVVVAGAFATGKTELLKQIAREGDYPYLNLNPILAKQMLAIDKKNYATKSQQLLTEIVEAQSERNGVIVVDNMELLFSKEVGKINPIDVFRQIARDRVVVLGLPGSIRGTKVEYSKANRPDYMEMDVSDVAIFPAAGGTV